MIKFFRKIRQQLLAENKTGRYFKYAIGEIILVVIGILIAVQINDWNENRKIAKTNSIHLQKMVKEMDENIDRMYLLTLDEEGIISGFPALDEAIFNCDSILNLSYMGLSEEDLSFILHAGFFAGHSILNLQQDVFEEMKSTGRLNTLGSDSLIIAIKDYSKRYLREVHYVDEHNNNVIRAIDKLEYGFGKMRLDYKMDPEHFDIANYPWYFNPESYEYQTLQIAFADALTSQIKLYEKMMVMAEYSEALKQLILDHLNTMDNDV